MYVRDRTLGADAQVSVLDSGPGVAAEERERIFERFQRGSATGGRSGFGLGLAIGRELAGRMGGSLTLVDPSERLGDGRHRGADERDDHRGTCFALRLPSAPLEDTAAGA